jgi:hypothetical protein
MLAAVGDFAYRLFEHRILANVNEAIDVHSAPYMQKLKPQLLQALANPIAIESMVLLAIFGVLLVHAYFSTLPSKSDVNKTKEDNLPSKDIPTRTINVGLTFDNAEVETVPDSSSLSYKFKLRVYFTNYSGEMIHLGVPQWREGVPPQGGHLTYSYQLRQPNNPQKPWGDEVQEVDVSAGRRCRIWLGLDPARREDALTLLDRVELGLLVIPVSTPTYSVNVRLRPADRGLRHVAANRYDFIRRVLGDKYALLSQQAKALLSYLCARRFASGVDISSLFERYHLPETQKAIADLSHLPLPFVEVASNQDVTLNYVFETMIAEIVKQDDSEFLALVKQLPTTVLQDRSNKEPGFKGRYDALISRQPL